MSTTNARYVWAFLAALAIAGPARPEGLQDSVRARARATEAMIEARGEPSLRAFLLEHLAPAFRGERSEADVLEELKAVRSACSAAGGVEWSPHGEDGIRLSFIDRRGVQPLLLRVESEPPHRIRSLELCAFEPAKSAPALTWDSVRRRLEEHEAAGFAGVVLIVRDGKLFLHEAYGLADREREIPNTSDTIFAIGSIPIAFTRAAILKLEELGSLATSQTIERFFPEAPDDKRAITLDHLMSGRSGLRDFHGIEGVDLDPDLSWIDRKTAVARILGQELLFPPGQGEAHSHSAWGLLAAIVEIVSGEPYADFLRKRFFEPAGMTRTGLHPWTEKFDEREIALGYGPRPYGRKNSPRHWGETSWLVMGSGGMVSNPSDLRKWFEALRGGRLLSPAALEKYGAGRAGIGGDERGFLCVFSDRPQSLMVLCSNVHVSMRDDANQLADLLVRLASSD